MAHPIALISMQMLRSLNASRMRFALRRQYDHRLDRKTTSSYNCKLKVGVSWPPAHRALSWMNHGRLCPRTRRHWLCILGTIPDDTPCTGRSDNRHAEMHTADQIGSKTFRHKKRNSRSRWRTEKEFRGCHLPSAACKSEVRLRLLIVCYNHFI